MVANEEDHQEEGREEGRQEGRPAKVAKKAIRRKVVKKAVRRKVVKKAIRRKVAKKAIRRKVAKKAIRRKVAKKVIKKEIVKKVVRKAIVRKAIARKVVKRAILEESPRYSDDPAGIGAVRTREMLGGPGNAPGPLSCLLHRVSASPARVPVLRVPRPSAMLCPVPRRPLRAAGASGIDPRRPAPRRWSAMGRRNRCRSRSRSPSSSGTAPRGSAMNSSRSEVAM